MVETEGNVFDKAEKERAPSVAGNRAPQENKANEVSHEIFTMATSNQLTQEMRDVLLESTNCDVGNAQRVAALVRGRMCYISDWEEFIVYDGKCWVKCQDKMLGVAACAMEVFHRVARDSGGESLEKFALASQNLPKLKAIKELLKQQPGISIQSGQLDRDPYLLNVQNGTIDLRTGELRPHDMEDYITRVCSVKYDPEATSPVFDKFFHEITSKDPDLRGYLKRACGYMATGDISEQCVFFYVGNGANGKSILMNQMAYVLKPYVVKADKTTLMNGFRNSGGASPDLVKLQSARIVFATELDKKQKFDEGLLKDMTGGEKITCRPLYGDYLEFYPQFKLNLSGNSRPQIVGTDDGIWRRLHMSHFAYKVPVETRDKRLGKKLEAEASGFLNWIIGGCLEWQKEGLEPPDCVKQAVVEYQRESSPFLAWQEDRCQEDENGRESAKDLLEDFNRWADENGEKEASQKALGAFLGSKGFQKKNSGGMKYFGISLKPKIKG
jgi:putative DNA primase/helicase